MGRLNKPAIPGYEYRAPNRTNANDLTPNLMEDVGASQRADLERIGRGLTTTSSRPRQTQEAAGRATSRSLGRAGRLSAAAIGGYELGKEIDREYPAVGRAIDKALDKTDIGKNSLRGTRAELTASAKQRLRDMGDDELQKAGMKVAVPDEGRYSKGGAVKQSFTRGDGLARKGKTKGRMC